MYYFVFPSVTAVMGVVDNEVAAFVCVIDAVLHRTIVTVGIFLYF